MSRLTDLVARAKASDPRLGKELEDELQHLMKRQHFGLVFERHLPEAVELPNKPVRPRDKVRILPPRGSKEKGDPTLWKVQRIVKTGAGRAAELVPPNDEDTEPAILPEVVPLDDLVVVAEVTDTIYPGLVETGRVERGTAEDPYHTVINAENFHALEMLTYTHRHAIDAIYIDPPYNTGAKDWKYNNDYVAGDDDYRHSKWLSMIERRLLLAKELLNPEDSVLIVTIDEKEYLRLGILLEQMFPEARIQMVSCVIRASGVARKNEFSRADEYIFFVMMGSSGPTKWNHNMLDESRIQKKAGTIWRSLQRAGSNAQRSDRPNLFYPVWVDPKLKSIHSVGDAIPVNQDRESVPPPEPGLKAVWPIRQNGTEGNWQNQPSTLRSRILAGTAKLGSYNKKRDTWSINYLREAELDRISKGELVVTGKDENGALEVVWADEMGASEFSPVTVWNLESHNAGDHGSSLVAKFIPNRKFPYPKSLYAVEDSLRFFLKEKPNATVLDFFSGSGTTAHAVMRLNKQDEGQRRSISITNNEVSPEEQSKLSKKGLRPGDPAWEQWGICDYVTKPRIRAAITGSTPEGEAVKGYYKYTDEFPMNDGFEANAAFFTLTYENSLTVAYHKTFKQVAPLLWLRAGSIGRMITQIPEKGWDVAVTYAIIEDLDRASEFTAAVAENERIKIAYIVTDDDRRFQMICRSLPSSVEPVRLYQSYLLNFQLNNGRGVA